MSKKDFFSKHKCRWNYTLYIMSWPNSCNSALPLCSWFSSSLLLLHQLWHTSNAAVGPFKSLNRNLTWPKKTLRKCMLSVKLAVWMIFGKSPAKKKDKNIYMSILLTCDKEDILCSKLYRRPASAPSFFCIQTLSFCAYDRLL